MAGYAGSCSGHRTLYESICLNRIGRIKRFFLKAAQIVTKGNIKEFSIMDEAKDWLANLK